ncbi:MAG: two-component system, OmpR family, sensor histidine kinase MtrB [Pseudonocardiales bacterium]|nr:two-component system, OmpR family, sensor histidine kinase MtrB [Pseudonocardiales bacterium]
MISTPVGERLPAVRRRGVALAHAAGSSVRRAVEQLHDAWRRSLQVRVGATTVVVTGIVVVVIGIFLVDKVNGGILHAKRTAAIDQMKADLPTARTVLIDADPSVTSSLPNYLQAIATFPTTGSSAGTFTPVLVPASAVPNVLPSGASIPLALRNVVRQGNLATQYAPVPDPGDPTKLVKGLIVGEPVQARTGLFELYYMFPLTAEQQTINLVQRTVLLAGIALVALVLIIAMLVTRQVVLPVRVAAQTAGRLAAGDLSKRITVQGSDDIGRLGQSFNDMADSLQRQIRRLEELSRLQRRFTSDVSHELRTPLTTIRMAAEYLHRSRTDFAPELSRAAELLHTELDRFEALLADLLEISRYDAGAAQLDSEPVDIRGVVQSSVEANRMLADRHDTEVVLALPDTAITVDMDARRVERILRNLVGNALDHAEGKPVTVTVSADPDAVAVTVRDHGVGLRPGQAALVFNRFWRGDPSRSRLTGGTGLGLAIALEDARLHDGWLQAWGEPGGGAQFRLTLPRHAGHTLLHSPLPLVPDDVDEDEE